MSGDVQPRKRKDKRKKKGSLDARRSEEYSEESAIFRRQSSTASDEDDFLHHHHGTIGGSDEVIHIHKESKLGGNFCSKIVFFGLLGALGLMVGLIIIEYQGTSDVDTQSAANSPWSVMLEGWVDDKVGHNDHGESEEHDEIDQSSHEEEDDGRHEDHVEGELVEGDHDHDEEEETEEEIEDTSYVQQTYNDLKAAYSQLTPEESDVEQTEEDNPKSTDYEATESEPEVSEIEPQTEEEEEEEDRPEDDPRGQWKSASGPDLLAEEVEDVQTESDADEESEDEASTKPASGGPKSTEIEESEETQGLENEVSFEQSEKPDEPVAQNEDVVYHNADITNPADWDIREDLDEADRDLDEGDFPI